MGGELIYRVLDYTEYPGPRYKSQGVNSGEDFYHSVLKGLFEQVVEKNDTGENTLLVIDLDSTAGYASSFLDEAFGNLSYDFGKEKVSKYLRFKSKEEPDWITIIMNETVPEWDSKRQKNIPRKPNLI